jgi:hypothetical protein
MMVVRVESDFPGCVVNDPVMVAAEENKVPEAGLAAVGPVLDVVGVAHDRWSGAAGEGAVPVAQDQGGPDGEGDQASGAAHIQGFAVARENGGDDLGVTRQPADGGHRELGPPSPLTPTPARPATASSASPARVS